jgi:hypothetical protein
MQGWATVDAFLDCLPQPLREPTTGHVTTTQRCMASVRAWGPRKAAAQSRQMHEEPVAVNSRKSAGGSRMRGVIPCHSAALCFGNARPFHCRLRKTNRRHIYMRFPSPHRS